jgi:hypothetical protein
MNARVAVAMKHLDTIAEARVRALLICGRLLDVIDDEYVGGGLYGVEL